MIQPIKQNQAFLGTPTPAAFQKVAQTQPAPKLQAQSDVQPVAPQEVPAQKEKKGNIFHRAKIGIMNTIKSFNNVKNTTAGVIRGVAEGAAATAVIGTIGHNFIKSEHKIGGTIKGTLGDIGQLPVKFYKYMGSKKLIALTAVVSAGFIALRTIQGKINANKANANIDHALNEGHTK
ncbi:MAG: hypothetical protein IJ877_04795 [Candidatus Gastranaerophilales bacterium]|nr:hypothetical protein [Candidatus Gastranaerophilales bacterium]